MGDLIGQFFQFLEQLILPNWPDLIALLPWVLVAIVVAGLLWLALAWTRTSGRNRSRVPKPLAGGAPPPGVHMPGPSRWPFVAPIGAALLLFAFALPPKDASGNATGPFNIQLLALGLIVLLISIAGWLYDAMREWRAVAQPGTGHGTAVTAGAHASMALVPAATAAARRPGAFGAAAAPPVVEERAYAEPPPGVHMPGPSPWPFFAPIGVTVMLYGFIFSSVLIVGGLILTIIAIVGWYLDAGHEYRSTEAVGHAVPATRDPQRVWPRRLVPVYGAVIAISLAVTLAPIGLGYLNSLTPVAATPGAPQVPAKPQIAAQAVKFDTANLIVPAARPFELTFNNNDPGVPHNVQIDTADKSQTLFDGERFDGVASRTYNVPALEPGTYYFLCAVHPSMNGTVTAAPETGQPQPGGGAPPAGNTGGETPAPQSSAAP
jgi:plastocyanin